MTEAKIQLSDAEMELVCNAELILTKNRILQKAKTLLESLAEEMALFQQNRYPNNALFTIPPKVSKGENYKGLPYLILDYPRAFSPSGIFAVRSFFWWGHFFSSTLQVSGLYKPEFEQRIINAYEDLRAHGYFAGISEDPWQHHFSKNNYQSISELSKEAFATVCRRQAHIKIAASWPLHQWPLAAGNLLSSWKKLIQISLD